MDIISKTLIQRIDSKKLDERTSSKLLSKNNIVLEELLMRFRILIGILVSNELSMVIELHLKISPLKGVPQMNVIIGLYVLGA